MAGDGCYGRVSHFMDVSVDLSNASHYDMNDASQGFSIWTEDSPGLQLKSGILCCRHVFRKKNGSGNNLQQDCDFSHSWSSHQLGWATDSSLHIDDAAREILPCLWDVF